jgi:hypothetical protein
MRRTAVAAAVALTAIGVLPNASAQSNTFTVDCNRGQRIATALELGDFRKPVVINVRGTCREFVTITRANVTLRGDPTAEIVAPDNGRDLLTVSADRVTLENLTLTGGLAGLSQDHAPTFIARSCVIQDTSGVGVRVRVGDARLINCTVQRSGGDGVAVIRGGSVVLSGGSQVLDSAGAGISATQNSVVSLNNATVMRSGGSGIVLNGASHGSVGNGSTIAENAEAGMVVDLSQANVAGGSTIRDNGVYGVGGSGSQISIADSTITGNGHDGVLGYIGTTLFLRGNVITNNKARGVSCHGNCVAQIVGATIEDNAEPGIILAWGSKLILEGPATTLNRNGQFALFCHDKESSVLNPGFLNTTDPVECTDFDN